MINREQWLEDRKSGIGGSDASAALGLSRWKQPLQLFLEKRGQIPGSEETEPMRWGTLLEPIVRQEYAERTGRIVRVPDGLMRHDKYPFVIGTPDGATDDGRLLEIKTSRSTEGWGDPGTDAIPQDYMLQVQHYLFLTGFVVADVAVLIGGSDFRIYEVEQDTELQEMLIDGEASFWQMVVDGIPPAPDFEAPDAVTVIRRLYPGTNGQRVMADPNLERWYHVMQEASQLAAQYELAAGAARAHILYEQGENALLAFSDGKSMRRKECKRKGYTVEATTYMDARIVVDKEGERQ